MSKLFKQYKYLFLHFLMALYWRSWKWCHFFSHSVHYM